MDGDRLVTEVYSFVSWSASIVAFFAWLLWALVPDDALRAWGVTYYPDKWWALALPLYGVVVAIFVVYAYVALNMMCSCPPDSVDIVRDGSTRITTELFGRPGEIPDVRDVDMATVNAYLFPAPIQEGPVAPSTDSS